LNALKYNKTLTHEIGLYIIHGLLHLNGHGDKMPSKPVKCINFRKKYLPPA